MLESVAMDVENAWRTEEMEKEKEKVKEKEGDASDDKDEVMGATASIEVVWKVLQRSMRRHFSSMLGDTDYNDDCSECTEIGVGHPHPHAHASVGGVYLGSVENEEGRTGIRWKKTRL